MSVVLNFDNKATGQLQRGSSQRLNQHISESYSIRGIRDQLRYLYQTVVEVLMKNEELQWLLFIFCAAAVLLDYLFAYIPVINDDRKCILLNKSFGIIAVSFRVALDFLFIVIIFSYKFKFSMFKSKRSILNALKEKVKSKAVLVGLLLQQFINVLLFSPVVQLMVVMIITSRGKKRLIFPALNSLLALHVPRLAVVIKLVLKTRRNPTSRFATKLAYLFAFIYIYSSQLFAALWYILALYKETRCWEKAYWNRYGHSYDIFNCSSISSEDSKYVSDYCSLMTMKYDFGIYTEVHQSGILDKKNSVMKILYFSRWALQCLSSFAQGLRAGVDVSGNIFVIFIMVSGVVMFFFLIGEVQSQREKVVKMKLKLRETEHWLSNFEDRLSHDLRSQVKKYQKDIWQETGANIENLLHNLPENLRREMTLALCVEPLKKVQDFGPWSKKSLLEDLCSHLKPVCYVERTRIIREGDPIDEMLFVVTGTLWTYTKANCSSKASFHNSINKHPKDVDIYGKELVNWVRDDPYTLELPVSNRTIQAVTNVEAFVLSAYNLKTIFIKRLERAVVFIQLYCRFRRLLISRRNAQNRTQEARTTNTKSAMSAA